MTYDEMCDLSERAEAAGVDEPKPATFTFEVKLGNEAMCEAEDIAEALAFVAGRFAEGYDLSTIANGRDGYVGTLRDRNGNRVGSYYVTLGD